jgi:hypothetical protein
VLSVIASAGAEGVARRDLGKRTHLAACRLNRVLDHLQAAGQVREWREPAARRPITRYFAASAFTTRRAA